MKRLLLSLNLACATNVVAQTSDAPLDYALLSHKVSIDLLRAGNHDPSGTNRYHFKVAMHGLLNSSEERNLAFDKRKKNTVELGTFGDTTLEALSAWKPDEKVKETKELRIEGNQIRELVAKTMTDLKVKETDVAVMVEMTLLVKSKRYFVLTDEHEITRVNYYPIAPTKFDTPFRTNIPLTMVDDKGTQVRVAVTYDTPEHPPKAKAATATPDAPTLPGEVSAAATDVEKAGDKR